MCGVVIVYRIFKYFEVNACVATLGKARHARTPNPLCEIPMANNLLAAFIRAYKLSMRLWYYLDNL
jgi:hypothetical protein